MQGLVETGNNEDKEDKLKNQKEKLQEEKKDKIKMDITSLED